MAEMNMPQKRGKRKTHTPRVDLTPMVDLGFLLITFFMYTTTMAKPNLMDINMPSDKSATDPTAVVEESTITLIPVKAHEVVYYEGSLKNEAQLKKCAIGNIRAVLLDKMGRVKALPAGYSTAAHKMYVLIKPNDDSKYSDIVQALDEMSITASPYYTLMDITREEKEMIAQKF